MTELSISFRNGFPTKVYVSIAGFYSGDNTMYGPSIAIGIGESKRFKEIYYSEDLLHLVVKVFLTPDDGSTLLCEYQTNDIKLNYSFLLYYPADSNWVFNNYGSKCKLENLNISDSTILLSGDTSLFSVNLDDYPVNCALLPPPKDNSGDNIIEDDTGTTPTSTWILLGILILLIIIIVVAVMVFVYRRRYRNKN